MSTLMTPKLSEAIAYFDSNCQEPPGVPDYLNYQTHMDEVLAAARVVEMLEALPGNTEIRKAEVYFDGGPAFARYDVRHNGQVIAVCLPLPEALRAALDKLGEKS